jgi:Carboxypeptidase regulatory-like domain/Surface antigen variable number repeat
MLSMKRLLSCLISLALCAGVVVCQQAATARLNGKIVDNAGGAIAKAQITIENATNSFKVVSDENGRFQIDLPPGTYEMRSDKLPGFAATKRKVSVATGKVAEVTIVPAVSDEGVLCILTITTAVDCAQPTSEQRALIREAEAKKYTTRRVEFVGNRYTRDMAIRRRIIVGLQEGDLFTQRNYVRSLRNVSKLRAIYPVRPTDGVMQLNRDEKTVDLIICIREKPR